MTHRARLGWLVVAVAIAIATTWPTAAILGSRLPGHRLDGDVALNLWALSWMYHQLPRDPVRLLDANSFHPATATLALSDLLLGEALLGLPALPWGPTAAYGLAFLLARAASALAMAALLLRLTREPIAALAGAAWFASLGFVAAHVDHLQLQFIGCFPWVVLAILRLTERPGTRRAIELALAIASAAWFSGYYAVFAGLEAVLLGAILMPPRNLAPARRWLGCLALAAVCAGLFSLPPLLPHLLAGTARSIHQTHRHAADPADYLLATRASAASTDPERDFGVTLPLALAAGLGAIVGLSRPRSRRATVGLLALAAVGFVLSLGPTGPLVAVYPTLMGIPGVGAVRAPGRFAVLPLTVTCVLAGIAVGWAVEWLRRDRSTVRRRGGQIALAAALVLSVARTGADGALPSIPIPPPGPHEDYLASHGTGAILHLPAIGIPDERNARYMLDSRDHFRPLVNGYSGERPPGHGLRLTRLGELPAAGAIRLALDLDVRQVVVHAAIDDPLAAAATLPGSGIQLELATADARVYGLSLPTAPLETIAGEPHGPPFVARRPWPFSAPETLHYRLRWSGLEAGRVELSLNPGATPGTLRLRAKATTTRIVRSLYDASFEFDVELDAAHLLPHSAVQVAREGARHTRTVATYDPQSSSVRIDEQSFALADHAYPPIAALYVLRTLSTNPPPEALWLQLDDFGKPLRLDVEVLPAEPETVAYAVTSSEPGGDRRELRLEVVLENGGQRRPLRIGSRLKVGEVVLELEP